MDLASASIRTHCLLNWSIWFSPFLQYYLFLNLVSFWMKKQYISFMALRQFRLLGLGQVWCLHLGQFRFTCCIWILQVFLGTKAYLSQFGYSYINLWVSTLGFWDLYVTRLFDPYCWTIVYLYNCICMWIELCLFVCCSIVISRHHVYTSTGYTVPHLFHLFGV